MHKDSKNAYMTDLLQALIELNIQIMSVEVAANWVEVDTVDDLELAETRRRLSEIRKGIK